MTGISTTEAVVGAGASVLAILGLLGVWPLHMAACATLAVGAALLIEGAAIAAQYSRLTRSMHGGHYESTEIIGSTTTQLLGGLAGTTLGVLALLGIQPLVLLPIAAIVFGGSLLFGTPAPLDVEVESVVQSRSASGTQTHYLAHQAMNAAGGSRVLIGLGSATLGILVLAGVGAALVLTLIAMLSIGAAGMLSGSALGMRMGMSLRHYH